MIALAALIVSPFACAQGQVVIYRCTDARGGLTIQNNVPCPKGSRQERRVLEAPPPAPMPPAVIAPAAAVSATAPPPPQAAAPAPPSPPVLPDDDLPTIADADRLPPPALYECRTYNDDHYLSEDGSPAPRCVTLTTVGLGGLIEASPGSSACEMKMDTCQRVPDGAVCDSWRLRLREAESALRFGASENQARTEEQFRRIRRIVRDSTCGR